LRTATHDHRERPADPGAGRTSGPADGTGPPVPSPPSSSGPPSRSISSDRYRPSGATSKLLPPGAGTGCQQCRTGPHPAGPAEPGAPGTSPDQITHRGLCRRGHRRAPLIAFTVTRPKRRCVSSGTSFSEFPRQLLTGSDQPDSRKNNQSCAAHGPAADALLAIHSERSSSYLIRCSSWPRPRGGQPFLPDGSSRCAGLGRVLPTGECRSLVLFADCRSLALRGLQGARDDRVPPPSAPSPVLALRRVSAAAFTEVSIAGCPVHRSCESAACCFLQCGVLGCPTDQPTRSGRPSPAAEQPRCDVRFRRLAEYLFVMTVASRMPARSAEIRAAVARAPNRHEWIAARVSASVAF
jgi:hypothetical protein